MPKLFLYIPVILCFSACTHYYYIPTTQNVPLFKEKNEIRLSGSVGQGSEVSATDVQAAYSFTDKFAAMVNFMHARGGDRNSENYGTGDYLDAGIGYFKALDDHGIFEIYGGIGGCTQQHQYRYTDTDFFGKPRDYSGSADLAFSRVYLQPTFGLTFNGFDFALTTGMSNIYFHQVRSALDPHDAELPPLDTLSGNRNSFLFEPSLTLRGGWKYVKLQLQILSSHNFSHPNLKFEKGKVSLGIVFSFAERFASR